MKYFNTKNGDYTEKDVSRRAWLLYEEYIRKIHVYGYHEITRHIDRRYNFNNEVITAFNRILKNKDARGDNLKHLERRKNRENNTCIFSNVLENHLYTDYKYNRFYLRRIHPTYLEFSGRNHHARNEFDKKVLYVLAKYFYNTK